MSEKRFVYADNAATTKVHPEVAKIYYDCLTEAYGNPSSLYSTGRNAKSILEDSRNRIAAVLGCLPMEIFFTSCGSESDNWAIKGAAYNAKYNKKIEKPHLITTKIEHHAVLHTHKALEKQGFEVTYLDVDKYGMVSPEDVKNAIKDTTCLISVMYANNEVGTIQPVKEIAKIANEAKVTFFSDGVQAAGNLPINLSDSGIDMFSLSGHKIHAPKGVGALYIRKGTRIANLIDGGGQERSKRAGTENIAGIAALARAMEIAKDNLSCSDSICAKRDRLIKEILKIPYTQLTGHPSERLPGNASFVFNFIEGESLLLLLDLAGICVSTGSACSSNSLEPSHVLLSMGIPHEISHGSLRLSITDETTNEDVDYIIENVRKAVERLRAMSPLYKG